jgi:hypothetical protein
MISTAIIQRGIPGGYGKGESMPIRSQTYRHDPAERLDAKERVERLRKINPKLVDAMLDPGVYTKAGRLNVIELRRLTGQGRKRVYRDVARLREES